MKRIKWFWILPVLALLLMGAATPEIFFQMKDPVGDEHGYGTYQYPSNVAFRPYKGLFDLTEFKVWTDQPGVVYFDTTFQDNTNPWMAPEGFIHQNLRIFIDSVPGTGMVGLPQPGAYVMFNPKYAWDQCLRIAGWGNSQFISVAGGKLSYAPLKTEVLADNRTIRATVPGKLMGKPNRACRYYVLVGSYDGFGEDFFRNVRKTAGEWNIGGGYDEKIEPQVMDILAPDGDSQIRQLKSFDLAKGRLAQLEPVGAGMGSGLFLQWLLKLAGIIVLLLLAGFFLQRLLKKKGKISWFWIRRPDKPDTQTGSKGA